jgi:hypothetical protein
VVEFCTLLVADDHIRTNLNLLVEVTSEVNILGVLGNLSRRKQPARRIFATRTIRPQARTMLLEDVVEVGVELEWVFLLSPSKAHIFGRKPGCRLQGLWFLVFSMARRNG